MMEGYRTVYLYDRWRVWFLNYFKAHELNKFTAEVSDWKISVQLRNIITYLEGIMEFERL